MIPELGQFALVLALCLALVQAVLPLIGAQTGRREWMALARPAAAGQFVFVVVAYIILTRAFLTDDFSVLYVASNSSAALPTFYKFAAVWGGHEGSLLLWIAILATWTLAVVIRSGSIPEHYATRVIAVLGIVSVGFIAFALFASNPFERLGSIPLDGRDLNPLLQDPGMLVHPPVLYIGYVGMAVPFAIAVAALLDGKFDKDWARWARPWATSVWLVLTVGITFGSWWAYYELGWGGWWFWDAVENASFMPWLMATAMIHSLAVTEKRGIFKSWTLLLGISGFALTLFGTFLTRSPIVISVHSFASDPARGLFILLLLAVIVGGSLTLYAFRARELESEGGFELMSREFFLLANNVLLVGATLLVFFGTLYPVLTDWLTGEKASIGAPFFNVTFPMLTLPLAVLIGVGMHTAWKRMNASKLRATLTLPAILAVICGIGFPWIFYDGSGLMTFVGGIVGFWVCITAFREPARRIFMERRRPKLARAQWGMILGHVGIGVFILGATFSSAFSVETDYAVSPGESFEVAGYEFRFIETQDVRGANYNAVEGVFELRQGGELVSVMRPQERVYRVQTEPMTEAAIDGRVRRDVFLALGEMIGTNPERWSVRVRVFPLIRFIWFGALIMAIGGIVAITDKRFRHRLPVDKPVRASTGQPATEH